MWCRNVLWGPDFDFIERFSTNNSTANYGGNIESIPPHTSPTGTTYPWGRILLGGGNGPAIGQTAPENWHMPVEYGEFFNALGRQATYLEVSTEWLAVGHVDEHSMVVPAPALPRGWAMLLSSPSLATQKLQQVQNAGGGNLAVFQGRAEQTTVNAILANTALMTFNQEVQLRMNGIRQFYVNNVGLANSEIIDLPVLFEDTGGGFAVAYNPGVVNCNPLPRTTGPIRIVVPDPEGPDQPTDVWAAETQTRIQALGTVGTPIIVTFADVYNSYHVLMGEAHCGTNWVRTPPAGDWWSVP
jgi:protein-arginine deiminase